MNTNENIPNNYELPLEREMISSLSSGAVALLIEGAKEGSGSLTTGTLMRAFFNHKEFALNNIMINNMGANLGILMQNSMSLHNTLETPPRISKEILDGIEKAIKEQKQFNQIAKEKGEPEKRELFITPDNLIIWMRLSPPFNKSFEGIVSPEINPAELNDQLANYQWTPNLIYRTGSDNAMDAFGKNLSSKNNQVVVSRENEVQEILAALLESMKSNVLLVGAPGTGKTAIVQALANLLTNAAITPDKLLGYNICSINPDILTVQNIGLIMETAVSNDTIVFIDEVHTALKKPEIANALKPFMADAELGLKLICATTLSEVGLFEADKALERRFSKVVVSSVTSDQTFQILESKKQFLEEVHKLYIEPQALEVAVTLSNRYMTGSQPAKAITLLDRACANVVSEQQTKPAELVQLGAKINALEVKNKRLLLLKKLTPKAKLDIDKNQEQAEDLKVRFNDLKTEYNQRVVLLKEKAEIDAEIINGKEAIEVLLREVNSYDSILKIKDEIIPDLLEKRQQVKDKLILVGFHEIVTAKDIENLVEKITSIKIGNSEKVKAFNLEEKLNFDIKGQQSGIETICDSFIVATSGMKDHNKPTGSFLILGTTGVGKTMAASKIAEHFYGSKNSLKIFSMTEFMDQVSDNKLFGASPGYVGYEEGGQLINWVKSNPYSVIVFDEIEKAHPRVRMAILKVLNEGVATSGKGETVDMTNCTIVCTTNAGADIIAMGLDQKKEKEFIEKELKKFFLPEFLNRLTKVKFNSLSILDLREIVQKDINQWNQDFLNNQGIDIKVTQEFIDLITLRSLDTKLKTFSFGAREIERALKTVKAKTSKFLAGQDEEECQLGVIYLEVENEEVQISLISVDDYADLNDNDDYESALDKLSVNSAASFSKDVVDADVE